MPCRPSAGTICLDRLVRTQRSSRASKKSASLMVDFLYSSRTTLGLVADANLPPVAMGDKVYRNGLVDARDRGVRIRIVTK